MQSKTLLWTTVTLFLALAASAQSEFPISNQPTGQVYSPELAVAPDGTFIAVWSHRSAPDGVSTKAFGRRFRASGTPATDVFQINQDTTDPSGAPVVATGPGNEFVVIWHHAFRNLLGRRFNAAGDPLGQQFELTEKGKHPDVQYLDNGDFAVVWGEFPDVLFQRFAPDATPRFQAKTIARNRTSPRLTRAADGEFVVALTRHDYAGPSVNLQTILARRFDHDGEPLGSEIEVSTPKTSSGRADISRDVNGRFLVVWEDYGDRSFADALGLGGRLIAPDGTPLGVPFLINSRTTGIQDSPRVAVDSGGHFLVVWVNLPVNNDEPADGSGHAVRGQRIDSRGLPVGEELQLSITTFGNQVSPVVAPTLDGAFITAWLDDPERISGDEQILGRRLEFPCTVDGKTSCLADGRFRLEAEWQDDTGRRGVARSFLHGTGDSDLLYFFDPENWEMLVKVVNGCAFNDHYWLFAAGTTNLGYTLRVTDTVQGTSRIYTNPLGRASPAITDTAAFATCP